MQNKGVIKLFAIVFGLICIYYLSFTYSAKNAEKKAVIHANGDVNKEKGYLVVAERDGFKLDFADFGNSPFYFTPEVISGKEQFESLLSIVDRCEHSFTFLPMSASEAM